MTIHFSTATEATKTADFCCLGFGLLFFIVHFNTLLSPVPSQQWSYHPSTVTQGGCFRGTFHVLHTQREATLPPATGLRTGRFTQLSQGIDHYAVGNSHVHRRSKPQAFSAYIGALICHTIWH